ncbi:zinc-dependent alcohol dehydrogenase family protein [Actinoallomurus purpureus]|uniref:zinc-dependent alcohol dehydrogenase family protein n=1 Tax=Actinoallomurus purpureus TaxID=478114 RepID=UPI002092AC59|nr:zinc-dependent alcohol dehydrogenase family protein [Actinoallomurus purpureus]MCO6005179.1 zinc-dependent alcohol dehydrogenase family protein [Actinoallomurus purpureus]
MMATAVLFDELGGPEALRLEKVRIGEPGEGQVQVRIDAIGLNRSEALFRAGGYYYQPTLPASRLGTEAAGVVEAVGSGVDDFTPGDAVSILATGINMSSHGIYGDRVNVAARSLLRRPDSVDAITGAAVWLSYLTAYGALVEVGRMNPGDEVVITAASSSVGMAAIQIADHLGAVPIAVTRTAAKTDRLLRAGAAHVLAMDEGDLVERVHALTSDRGARLVFDSVGGPGLADLARTVARDGILIVYGWLDPRPAPLPMNWPLNIFGFGLNVVTDDPAALRRGEAFINAGLRSGALKPVIDATFDLADIADAHRHMEANGQLGKIVVTVQH